jgi:hypothetical protein
MAATTVGLVYSLRTNMLRRIILPDTDVSIVDQHIYPLAQGEGMFVVARTLYNSIGAKSCLALRLGVAVVNIPDERCAVIDTNGNVVQVIQADATLDAVPGFTLMNHKNVQIGWTLKNGVLTPPAVAVPPQRSLAWRFEDPGATLEVRIIDDFSSWEPSP